MRLYDALLKLWSCNETNDGIGVTAEVSSSYFSNYSSDAGCKARPYNSARDDVVSP